MQPRSSAPSRAFPVGRGAFAVVLALLVAAVVDAQPKCASAVPARAVRASTDAQPDKKEPDKKEEPKLPEIKWPTEIDGRDIATVMKNLEDPDPVIREYGARLLPQFGPPAAQPTVSKVLIRRMNVERDPGVKAAVYAAVGGIQFVNEADNKEAMRLLVSAVDNAAPGSSLRLAAVQAIAQFGAKGSEAITVLTGNAMLDPSYGTRQHIAIALGRIGFNETAGPNMRALSRLADNLARDESAAVRMEALQSLMMLGPPWAAPKAPGAKMAPPTDTKNAEVIIKFMRARVGDPKAKIPSVEKDKQVEIWGRLVLMRFDPREINDDNLDAITRYLTGADNGVKVQALQAIGLIGEGASRKLNDVLRLLEDKDAPYQVTVSAIQVLGALGAGAKPGLPNMQKFLELKKAELAKKKMELAKKKEDLTLIGEVAALEAIIKLLEGAMKHIDEAKPLSPASEPKSSDPKSDPPKKP
jgi:HEAT repeat protein